MLVLSFAASGWQNCANVGGTPFVYARTDGGSFLMPAQCSHRGGPLHLASLDPCGARLVCPWHGRSTSVAKAQTTGIPAVRRGNVVTAVFPQPPGTPHVLEYRPMSAELTRARLSRAEGPASRRPRPAPRAAGLPAEEGAGQ